MNTAAAEADQFDNASRRRSIDDVSVTRLLTEKETEILQLKNEVLERERRLIDSDENCRESQQLLEAKSKAIQILRKQILDLQVRCSMLDCC